MSNIYIQEPPTNGKVLFKTSAGDIDLELWSKEAPKACRNFVQLCLEGYYNNTIFHRVVKNFIVQGGDPTGTGTGGDSIYGEPFKDEFHSRLRFNRRGLVAMANAGRDDNASQFFFTLAATPELQNKHTIFGKVTRETIYNVLKLQETLVDKDERPLYPHKILKTEVLHNPFPDIIPRVLPKDSTPEERKEERKRKEKRSGVKNFKLLSFGEEAEEDEEANSEANRKYSGRSKSTHDLLNDPKLSAKPAVLTSSDDVKYDRNMDSAKKQESVREYEENEMEGESEVKQDSKRKNDEEESRTEIGKQEGDEVEDEKEAAGNSGQREKIEGSDRDDAGSEEQLSGDEDTAQPGSHVNMESLRKKLKRDKQDGKSKHLSKDAKEDDDFEAKDEHHELKRANKIREEIQAIKREIQASKRKQSKDEQEKEDRADSSEGGLETEYLKYHEKYKTLKNTLPREGPSREEFTMALLSKFQMRLAYARDRDTKNSDTEVQPHEDDEEDDNWKDVPMWSFQSQNATWTFNTWRR